MNWWRLGQNRPHTALKILTGAEWTCEACADPHIGMIDLAPFAPHPWGGTNDYAPNSAVTLDGDFLSEDFCVMDGRYFMVRCVMEIPVHGMEYRFGFGCWGSLSRTNFEVYLDLFDNGEFEVAGPWSSWLCNQFCDYIGDDSVACWMVPQLGRQRPLLNIADEGHPLARDQRSGVSPERVMEYYKFYGHAPSA